MPSVIERASSGRAKCRVCGQAIAKGEARFGEALPSAYGEGESLFWFHLPCAACARPESLLPVLAETTESIAERAPIEALARAGLQQPRLCRIVRAERASSGRAKCRHCRELIAQGAWRISLHLFEEGRFTPIGTIHASCGVGYFGVEAPLERLKLPGNELGERELAELAQQMRDGAAHALALASPGLAKAPAPEASVEEAESTRKTS
jgi:ribosomal protein L37AE/L43A